LSFYDRIWFEPEVVGKHLIFMVNSGGDNLRAAHKAPANVIKVSYNPVKIF